MMKRLGSSDSLGALISMCPASDDHSPRSNIYSRDYQSMLDGLDEEGCVEESGHIPEKKRRLSVDQVKALEKNFEVENKLEPDRKVKLASELGLQPRQVAVWFQNRRARWKTKQLERDYGVLKSNFDNLKHNYESLQHDKDALLKEIKQLRAKLNDENPDTESNMCIKEEVLISESDNPNIIKDIEPITPPPSLDGGSDDAAMVKNQFEFGPTDFNSGPSDSDSSAILNEDNISSSPNASNSSYGGVFINNQQHQLLLMSPNSSSLGFNASSSSPPPPPSSINCFNFSDTRSDILGSGTTTHHDQSSNNNNNINVYHPQLVKLEEHNFFSGDETCNIFSDEAAPTLNWYCPDQWNLMLTHQGGDN